MCIWAINSSCDRKMRRLENVPWESKKMQEASKKVWKVGNWEAESYGLLEETQRRSFPNSSDERVGAIDESWLTLIRLSWHWDDSASFPPLRLHFVPHRQMIIDAPFISSRATEVCPCWGFPASLPPAAFPPHKDLKHPQVFHDFFSDLICAFVLSTSAPPTVAILN